MLSIAKMLCIALLFVLSLSAYADGLPAIVYFNGIDNSAKDTERSRLAIEYTLNKYTAGDQYEVSIVHNPKGLYDKHELLQLKTFEENYFENLQRLTCSFGGTCATDYKTAQAVCEGFFHLAERNISSSTTSIVGGGEKVNKRMLPTQNAVTALMREIKKHDKVVIVAHSEANLLIGPALACHAVSQGVGTDIHKNIRVINVANTANVSHSGLDLTHDEDMALAILDRLPALFMGWKRTTLRCNDATCSFVRSKPTLKIINRPNPADPRNQISLVQTSKGVEHSFVGTYLSEKLEVDIIKGELGGVQFNDKYGQVTFADRFRDVVQAAVESLSEKEVAKPTQTQSVADKSDIEAKAKATLACYTSKSHTIRHAKSSSYYESDNDEVDARKRLGYNDDPFFAVGDFNQDGHIDLAATLIFRDGVVNKVDPRLNAGVVIFNGPITGDCMEPSFVKLGVVPLYGAVLSIATNGGLFFHKWESFSRKIIPVPTKNGGTYRMLEPNS